MKYIRTEYFVPIVYCVVAGREERRTVAHGQLASVLPGAVLSHNGHVWAQVGPEGGIATNP
jgi:hypothetical protein